MDEIIAWVFLSVVSGLMFGVWQRSFSAGIFAFTVYILIVWIGYAIEK